MARTFTVAGSDISGKIRLDSWVIEMKANGGEVGAGSVEIDDTTGSADDAPAMKEWRAKELLADPQVIGGGYIAERDVQRGPLTVATQRQFKPTLEDWNAGLSDRVLRGSRARRKAETDVQRIRWLLRSGAMRDFIVRGRFDDDPSNAVDMDAADYRGKYPFEALQDCAEESDKNFFVYWRKPEQDWALYYHSDPLDDSTVQITDVAADVDSSTVFGASDIDFIRDPGRIYSGIYLKWREGWVYEHDSDTRSAYRRREKSVTRERMRSAARARRWAAKQLAKLNEEKIRLSLTVSVPGSLLGELRAGMRIQVKLTSRGVSSYTWFRIIGTTIRQRSGGLGVSDVEYDVRLELRDKVRVLDLSPGGGGTDGADDPAGSGDEPRTPAVTDYFTLDDFSRVVAPPTTEAGDALGVAWEWYKFTWGQQQYLKSWPPAVYLGEGGTYGPTLTAVPSTPYAVVWVGDTNTPWSVSPFGCGVGFGDLSGWHITEAWTRVTITEHPEDMAGIRFSVVFAAANGVGATYGAVVRVASEPPSSQGHGSLVGHIPGSGGEVLIPAGLVPSEGEDMWVCVACDWQGDFEGFRDAYPGGYLVACTTSKHSPLYTGQYNSGQLKATLGTATWEVVTAAGQVVGTIEEVEGAPWEGGNTWTQASTEGSPTYSQDGEALIVSSDEPSGYGIYLQGSDEDEDQPPGPWSNLGWATEVVFEVDAHGDTSDAGLREIELRTTGDSGSIIGRVHLGDTTRAEGISVASPINVDYVAKALTLDEKWVVRFDARSGSLRGKLWKQSDGMPAAWDVEVDIEDTEDLGDRFELWVRVGNDGSSQQVKVHRLEGAAQAESGQLIENELIGLASGDENTFKPSHDFQEGSLSVLVNGVDVKPTSEDGAGASARIDQRPTEGSIIHATYTVA